MLGCETEFRENVTHAEEMHPAGFPNVPTCIFVLCLKCWGLILRTFIQAKLALKKQRDPGWVCSSGAVILEWFHLILAMGDWLKSLNNQWDWVTGLCNGPVPGQGLVHLSPSWDRLAPLSGRAGALCTSVTSKKPSARLHWETPGPWRSQDRSQDLLRPKKPHAQLRHEP